jgi:hypothetical protein
LQRELGQGVLRRDRWSRPNGPYDPERLEIGGRYAPFLAQFEAAHVTVAQPSGDRALVDLEAVGNLGRRQKLFICHRILSRY